MPFNITIPSISLAIQNSTCLLHPSPSSHIVPINTAAPCFINLA